MAAHAWRISEKWPLWSLGVNKDKLLFWDSDTSLYHRV